MSDQTTTKRDNKDVAKQVDKKKKKHLLKTFLRQGITNPFRAPIGLIAHVPYKTCKKLGLDAESYK